MGEGEGGGLLGKGMLELSHNGWVVLFQAEKWEERHPARRHTVCLSREV